MCEDKNKKEFCLFTKKDAWSDISSPSICHIFNVNGRLEYSG